MSRVPWVGLVVLSSLVRAAPYERFEDGGWGAEWSVSSDGPDGGLFTSAAAGREGALGLRVVEPARPTLASGWQLRRSLGASDDVSYSRAWVRPQPWSSGGRNVTVLRASWLLAGGQSSAAAVSFGRDELRCISQGRRGDGGEEYFNEPCVRARVADGGWHLVELYADARGAPDASVRFAVDGVEVAQRRLPVHGFQTFSALAVGAVQVSGTAEASVIDLDDVLVADALQASRLHVDDDGFPSDVCAPMTVSLRATFDDAAAAWDPGVRFTATQAQAPVELFASSSCDEPLDTGVVPSGMTAATVWVRLNSAQPVSVQVRGGDLQEAVFVPRLSDAGVTPEEAPRSLYQCSTSPAGAGLLGVLSLLPGVIARRRRGTTGVRSS